MLRGKVRNVFFSQIVNDTDHSSSQLSVSQTDFP